MAASTGKPEAYDYLRRLGASEIMSRKEASAESNRPLEPERLAGSIDTVGGPTLAYLMRTTKKGGAIAAIGVAGGAAFRATLLSPRALAAHPTILSCILLRPAGFHALFLKRRRT